MPQILDPWDGPVTSPLPAGAPWDPAGEHCALSVVSVFVLATVRIYREGIRNAFGAAEGFDVAGTAGDAHDALAGIVECQPHVAVLDVAGDDGLELVRELRARAPATRIVVLAVRETGRDVIAWAEAGIAGYVTTDASLTDLVAAARAAASGEAFCAPRISAALLERVHTLAAARAPTGPVSSLTVREREIAELLVDGLTNKEIATRLHIELPTVKNHVHRILAKLGVTRRADAAAALRRHHLDLV